MNRRKFLCGLTLGLLAASLAADAQQTAKVYRIGTIAPGRPDPGSEDDFAGVSRAAPGARLR